MTGIKQSLIHIDEPMLMFGHGQTMENPKDGLLMFGPLTDTKGPNELRVGVIGRKKGLERYSRWVQQINGYIPAERADTAHHAAYPGFEAIFGCKWPISPICNLAIPEESIWDNLYLTDRHDAIFKTVGLFVTEIERYLREEDAHVDLWFVVIPEEVYTYGRPKSTIPQELRQVSTLNMTMKKAKAIQQQPSLFIEDNDAAEIYKYELHFHNQLKARLLENKNVVIQVARETSLAPEDFEKDGKPLRRLQDPASLAWNLTTTAYFKSSGKPWKLADVREGVCYVGLVFKLDLTSLTAGNACCGAQMFLDSGDGLVFKGAVGPWYSKSTKEFHLPKDKAAGIIRMIVEAYKREHGTPPKELFIHGRTRFDDEEWDGFQSAAPEATNLVGVRIREENSFKLFGAGSISVLRGTAFLQSRRKGYLWTRGYIPKLKTYPGREVPNPLSVEICRGKADLEQVMKDIMGLTKVNFNACIYADGRPVTLRFADRVGEILTATPTAQDLPPLPFKHYI